MKSTAKISLLLLLGAAQQVLEAKQPTESAMSNQEGRDETNARKTKPSQPVMPTAKANEKEKKRVIYNAIKNPSCPGSKMITLPQFSLEWDSLSKAKNVTEAQLAAAKKECDEYEKPVQELMKKRNDYLMHKYPVYAEEQKLIEALNKFWNEHSKELFIVCKDTKGMKEITEAQDKAQPSFWKYWQLQNLYDREHPQFHGPEYKPYMRPMHEQTPQDIQMLAKKALKINLAPGKSVELPMLYSGNGTLNPERIIKYSLAYPDGKMVTEDQAVLRTKTTTDKARVGMPGATATTYEYTVSLPRHAKPMAFYVLEHNVMGELSVYATVYPTVKVTKREEAMPAQKEKPKKAKTVASSKPEKMAESVMVKPVAAKHTPGKKAAVVPAPTAKKRVRKDDTNSTMNN